MPNHQGKLDWLCGPYSVINALERFGIKDHETMFQISLKAIARSRWPELLWTGTGIGDLNRMARAIITKCERTDQIKLLQPFRKSVPKNNKNYWDKFDQLFQHKNDCAVVLFERFDDLDSHWLVIHPNGAGGLCFIDSYDPSCPNRQVARSEVFAGYRMPSSAKYRIARDKLLLFKKTA